MYLVYKCRESCVGSRYALPKSQHLKKDALVHGDAFVLRLHVGICCSTIVCCKLPLMVAIRWQISMGFTWYISNLHTTP